MLTITIMINVTDALPFVQQLSMIQSQSPRPSTAREEIEFLAQNSKQRHAVNLGALASHISRGDALSLAVPNRIQTTTKPTDALTYFVRMRAQQPSAYGAFLQLKGYCIVSLAHQRLISRSSNGTVDCRPVALSVARRATQQVRQKQRLILWLAFFNIDNRP